MLNFDSKHLTLWYKFSEKQSSKTDHRQTWRSLWTWFHGEASGLDDLHLQSPIPLHQSNLYITWLGEKMRLKEVNISPTISK